MKSAIYALTLGMLIAASSAFADQCVSGDQIKINDDYSVVTPEGYRYIAIDMPITKTGPVSLGGVRFTAESSSNQWGRSFYDSVPEQDLQCVYLVGDDQSNSVEILIFTKNDSANRKYKLSDNWEMHGRGEYFCIAENAECRFD